MASHPNHEKKPEDSFTVALILIGCMCVLILLIWISNDVKIVNFWTPKLAKIGKLWLLLPNNMGDNSYAWIISTGRQFLHAPKAVSITDWLGFINKTIMIPVVIVTVVQLLYLVRLMFKDPEDVKRRLKPQALAKHLSHVFTGTAPVLHLRKALAQDTEPYWRRQVFPHEVLLNEKVRDKPLVVDGEVHMERAADYFRGIVETKVERTPECPDGWAAQRNGTRLVSRMLGRQVVDLVDDSGKNINFPDRFSNTGKVIYALLCAHAFGGEEGKADYAKARDALNNSARNAAHGFANLTVAQWLYDKYRSHPSGRKLFAVHHWEYTYLFELLLQAKRQGKCGHWEFMWLKPMNRILFYVMNTVGRFTPHTQSAGAFSQYVYERRVARRGRLPLLKLEDGRFVHVMYVEKAVKGLALEWQRWKDGEDDDQQWWLDPAVWDQLNAAVTNLSVPVPPPAAMTADTAFDRSMSEETQAAARRDDERFATVRKAAAEAGVDFKN